ncbi:hypothetical protein INT45_012048 [Circinella minor]|uniref:Uncharacterized protein n=1 Tax=Circinella minor TaxID=1195481 RepID=A0A8H7VUX7_9FUNG|nr:hypothetical protein INT45_012048 [Circinella minor]
MTAVVSILPTEYSRPEELKIQAQQGHHHQHQHYANNIQKENQDIIDLHDDEADEEDIVLLSPANTMSSSLSDDGTMSYPQTPTQQASHHHDDGTAINTPRLKVTDKAFEYNTMDDEAIMKSYLDPSPVTVTTINKNRKKGQALTRLKHILKNEGDDNNNHSSEDAAELLPSSSLPLSSSSPPPRSPSRSSNVTLTIYTPQLDTSKIIDPSSDSSSYHDNNQNHKQQECQNQHQSLSSKTNNNNSEDSNIQSTSSSSESTCSSTISSYSTSATSAASNNQRIVHDKISSPDHPHHLPHIHSDQHQHPQLRQPATRLSALAMHAAKRNEQYYFNHHQQNQHPSVRPIPTSSSRFKTALQIFRPNNNNTNNLHNHKNHNHINHSNTNHNKYNHNNHNNHSNTNNDNVDEPEAYHYHYSSQVNVGKNSISPSSVSEKILQDNNGKEPTINIVPSKSKSLAGRLKSKFQKKTITNSKNNHNSKNNSNGGSTSGFTVNMSRSASLSSITSSWSRLTQSRNGDHSKQKKQQQKSLFVGSGPSNQQRRSPQHHFSAIIQHQDNNRESTSSIHHSPARHSMYCTTMPMSTVSDDCRSLYHVQQEQKRRLHTHHHQQQKQKQQLHSDHYRHQHHGEQYQRPQYHRFRQQQHCRSQMGMDSKLTSSISTPPAATASPILRDTAATISGSIVTSSNITSTTKSRGDNIINRNCNNNVRFAKIVSVRETYARHEYDRGSDPDAVCTRLTPAMAYFIKEELNTYKLHEMQVHECSRENTHFFF